MQTLSKTDYLKLREFIYVKTGITIEEEKREILSTKIQKILIKRKMDDAGTYVKLLLEKQDPDDIREFINTITTNTTEFFRENVHFEYIKNNIAYCDKCGGWRTNPCCLEMEFFGKRRKLCGPVLNKWKSIDRNKYYVEHDINMLKQVLDLRIKAIDRLIP